MHPRKTGWRDRFLEEMEELVPWKQVEAIVEPFYHELWDGQPRFPLAVMVRVYFMQQWFGYSNEEMADALREVLALRSFACANWKRHSLMVETDEIASFREMVEQHNLRQLILEL